MRPLLPPTRPYDPHIDVRPSISKKALLRIAVAAVVVAVGIWSYTGWFGGHVTECGFDSRGPYAKVRVGSLAGGLGSMEHEQVNVFFTYDGARYANGYSVVKPAVLGTTTTVVRPPKEETPPPPRDPQKLGCSVHPPTNGWQ